MTPQFDDHRARPSDPAVGGARRASIVPPSEQLTMALAVTPDVDAAAAARLRADSVVRPAGAFRRLDDLAVWLAGWQGQARPRVEAAEVVIFGADHGVAIHGVSAYPADVTKAMAAAIEAGIATSSALAHAADARLRFVDVGVGEPTRDFTVADAMDEDRFHHCWDMGTAAVAGVAPADVLIVGELGIGNTTAAAAVAAGLFGGDIAQWVGRGTGVDDAGLERKRHAVQTAISRIGADPAAAEGGAVSALEVLRRVGGAELVAMAAAVSEARRQRIPVILDGFIATAAIASLEVAAPGMLDHTIAGHCSSEPGHRRLLEQLGKSPLIDLGLRLGEATGALVALPILRAAAAAVSAVATFDEAGVSGPAA